MYDSYIENMVPDKAIPEGIGLDKSVYQVNSFLISRRKHMLWVLIRSASARHF